jgi:phosphinothricin acetyltransferase
MEFSIGPILTENRNTIIDIFNYYVENSFAAFTRDKIPYQAFDSLFKMSNGYPRGAIKDKNGNTAGFGMLRFHNPIAAFAQTAEATYFIHPDHTRKGLGTLMLDFLEKGAIQKGITNILANISSLNPNSIRFHLKNGFIECGRFNKVGKKKGREFDTVWMQKRLQ